MNTVSVMLRYRPRPDVLVGEVDLPDVQLFTEVVDPDVIITWQATLEGEVLYSFQIVHASQRLAAGDVPLPFALLRELQRFVTVRSTDDRLESELVLSTSLLLRPTRRRTPAVA